MVLAGRGFFITEVDKNNSHKNSATDFILLLLKHSGLSRTEDGGIQDTDPGSYELKQTEKLKG